MSTVSFNPGKPPSVTLNTAFRNCYLQNPSLGLTPGLCQPLPPERGRVRETVVGEGHRWSHGWLNQVTFGAVEVSINPSNEQEESMWAPAWGRRRC